MIPCEIEQISMDNGKILQTLLENYHINVFYDIFQRYSQMIGNVLLVFFSFPIENATSHQVTSQTHGSYFADKLIIVIAVNIRYGVVNS